jgi:hypothetical protein
VLDYLQIPTISIQVLLVMTLHRLSFQLQLQPKALQALQAVPVDRGQVVQLSPTNRHSLLEELVLVVIFPRKEVLKTSTFSLATKHLQLRLALVRLKPQSIWFISNFSGYGIHYPIRHGQIENWVRF